MATLVHIQIGNGKRVHLAERRTGDTRFLSRCMNTSFTPYMVREIVAPVTCKICLRLYPEEGKDGNNTA